MSRDVIDAVEGPYEDNVHTQRKNNSLSNTNKIANVS
jgi:hypothetical protein